MSRNRKLVLLILSICGFYFVAYYFAFSKTIEAREEINDLKSVYRSNQRLSQNIQKTEKQNSYFDSIIQKNSISNTSLQNNILRYLNNYTTEKENGMISVVKFHKEHTALFKNTKVISYIVDLKGSYRDIEKLLYNLEITNAFKLGSINHISLEVRENRTKKKTELFTRVILQYYQ